MSDTPHDLGGETDIVTDEAAGPPDAASIRKFALPSLLGILTFLTPIRVEGNWTILMGFISDSAVNFVGAGMPWIVYVLLCVSALGTVWAITAGRPAEGSLAFRLFHVAPVWVALRLAGLIMGTMTMFQLGPEMFWSAETGGEVLNILAVNIVFIFLFAGLLMPFLTDYGLMEFIGTMLKRIFRRLFTLPGRSVRLFPNPRPSHSRCRRRSWFLKPGAQDHCRLRSALLYWSLPSSESQNHVSFSEQPGHPPFFAAGRLVVPPATPPGQGLPQVQARAQIQLPLRQRSAPQQGQLNLRVEPPSASARDQEKPRR